VRRLNLPKVALSITMLVLIGACGSKPAKSTSPTTMPPSTVSSSSSSSSSAPTSMSTLSITTTTVPPAFPYLYVWPFQDVAQAQVWQRSDESGGHQPWHLDPGITAESFTYFLGVHADIGEVIKVTENATGAHVAMGFHNPNGVPVTAMTVHEVRISSGGDAPWEVVNDDQTGYITLTTPSYGATVSAPIRVGGRITGVDESIRAGVYQRSSTPAKPIGEHCCLPAGGQSTPWTTTVSYSSAIDPVLVITASTGGHLQAVEQMAFTAVRRAS
jgi:hypothetical protein